MDILAKKATEPPAPIRPRNKSVPEPLERVILAALEKDPALRPQTMGALEYELNKCVKGRGSAVAAVLGLKTVEDNSSSWTDEGSRSGVFDHHYGGSQPITLHRPPDGFSPTLMGRAHSGELATRGLASTSSGDAPAEAPRPSRLSRLIGILGGLAFLGAGGYFAYDSYWAHAAKPHPVVAPTTPTDPTSPKPTTPKTDPGAAAVDPAEAPTPPTTPTTPADEILSAQQIADRLEWAQRAFEGGRIVAPPGDNLKELLDKIEKASPGNPRATELRNKASAALERRGILAQKKQHFEEAEDAFRALVVLHPDDEKAKERLARTLAVRADLSLEKHRYTAAVADANQALELSPDSVMAHLVLAEAHLATGKREVAAEDFRRVLEMRPGNVRAKKGLAIAMAPPPKKGPTKSGGKKR